MGILRRVNSGLLAFAAAFVLLACATVPALAIEPAHSKTLTDNKDGSYTLSLSVTGSDTEAVSEKADVVVMLDLSQSMELKVEDATGPYGYPQGKYIAGATNNIPGLLYKKTDTGYAMLSDDDEYSGDVYVRSGDTYSPYTGTRYTTRLAVAKRAAQSLVNDLLENNTAQDPDKVRVALVTFADGAVINQQLSSDESALDAAISNLTYLPGYTNWEAAFQMAGTIQMRSDATRNIVLVSDGQPNRRYTEGSGGSADDMTAKSSKMDASKTVYGNTTGESPMGYQYGLAAAQQLVDAGDTVYTVATNFNSDGSTSDMSKLVSDLGEAPSYALEGTDVATVNQAFSTLARDISGQKVADVKVTDGLTPMTATDAAFTYTVTDKEGATSSWNDAPTASYDDSQVVWDLSSKDLADGSTYTVSFKVWPNQDAYDLVADLNNGTTAYDSLTDAQKAQLIEEGDGTYALKTNTDATVDYTNEHTETLTASPSGVTIPDGQTSVTQGDTTYTKNGDEGYTKTVTSASSTAAYANPDPIPVASVAASIQKQWVDVAESAQPATVTFTVLRDGQSIGTVTVNASDGWKGTYYLAPGLIAGGTTLDVGHAYTLQEVSDSDAYTFSSTRVQPMIVNGAIQESPTDDSPTVVLSATNTAKKASSGTTESSSTSTESTGTSGTDTTSTETSSSGTESTNTTSTKTSSTDTTSTDTTSTDTTSTDTTSTKTSSADTTSTETTTTTTTTTTSSTCTSSTESTSGSTKSAATSSTGTSSTKSTASTGNTGASTGSMSSSSSVTGSSASHGDTSSTQVSKGSSDSTSSTSGTVVRSNPSNGGGSGGSGTPQAGDSLPIALIALAVSAGVALVMARVMRRKHE